MASIKWNTGGDSAKVRYTDRQGKPREIGIGRQSQSSAERFRVQFEHMLTAVYSGTGFEADTIRWLNALSDTIYDRFVTAGMVTARLKREVVTLGGLLDAFFAARESAVKAGTQVRSKQVRDRLLLTFSTDQPIESITDAAAEDWRADLLKHGYALATVNRTVIHARQVFGWAVKRGLTGHNPFASVKAGVQANTARAAFVDRPTIEKVLGAAPDAEWRLLIALARFGGLRTPSESLALRWADVDWAAGTITVRSTKTEHHNGKGSRVVPIFAPLLPYLRDAFEAAPAGAEYVIARYRVGANIGTQFGRIIARAGVAAWPRRWHNLRASCTTELANHFPGHQVAQWLGHSPAVAHQHYLMVTAADHQRAVLVDVAAEPTDLAPAVAPAEPPQEPLQAKTTEHSDEQSGSEVPSGCGFTVLPVKQCELLGNTLMSDTGLEHSAVSKQNTAHSKTLAPAVAPGTVDQGLRRLVTAWPYLAPAIRAAIMAVVGSAVAQAGGTGPQTRR
jgi:integrase